MQAVVVKDAFDAALTDVDAALRELLSDDRSGRIGIEKAMADDMANVGFGATRFAFGPRPSRRQSVDAAELELLAKLKIALSREAEFFGSVRGSERAFAVDQHGKASRGDVVVSDGQRASGTDKSVLIGNEVNHVVSSMKSEVMGRGYQNPPARA